MTAPTISPGEPEGRSPGDSDTLRRGTCPHLADAPFAKLTSHPTEQEWRKSWRENLMGMLIHSGVVAHA